MVKRGKMSQVDKFYIENNTDLTTGQIAKQLDRSEESVQKVRDAYVATENTPDNPNKTDAVFDGSKKGKVGELMGRRKERGITVMTKEASEVADDTRHSRTAQKKTNRFTEGSIHQPLGDDE